MKCKHTGFSAFLMLLGRICFSLLFIIAGYTKLMALNVAASALASHGVPVPGVMVFVATFLELVGGVLVFLGWYTRVGAFLVFLFVLPETWYFHTFWTVASPADMVDHFAHFFKNLSIIGGALYIMAAGAGCLSIDGLFRKECSE
jgi:putative oxidoreductase